MFEELFDKARQSMTTDSACDCGLTKDTKIRLSQIKDDCTDDAKMKIGEISHRKDGDYRKVAEGKFVPVKAPGKGGASKSAAKKFSSLSEAFKAADGTQTSAPSEQDAKKTDNDGSKPYKEGQTVPNAGAQSKNYGHKLEQYLRQYRAESDAHPGDPTDLADTLASLVQNARTQHETFRAVDDYNRGNGYDWVINSQTASKINDLQNEEKELLKKMESLNSSSERPDEVDPEIPGSGEEAIQKGRDANDFFENMRNALKSGNAPKRDESSDDFFARMRNRK